MVDKPELRRLSETHRIARELNERTRDAEEPNRSDEQVRFLCECGNEGCTETIALSLDEFEAIRWREHVYVVRPGHENPHAELVVDENERFVLVERP
jgi:hypothetical protein